MVNKEGLQATKVNRTKLLEAIRENRATHRAMFDEAMEGYRIKAVELLEQHIYRIRTNAPEKVNVSLPMPEDHTADYDQAIAMLEWGLDDEVVVSAREFNQYVLDDWGWKQKFSDDHNTYTKGQ